MTAKKPAVARKKITTQATLDALKPGATRREIPDAKVPGLYHIIQPTGVRSGAVRYWLGGKPRKHTLVNYRADRLADARREAAAVKLAIRAGHDPAAEKRAQRAAIIATMTPETVLALPAPTNDKVEDVVDAYVDHSRRKGRRERTWREVERLLKREVVPAWRGRCLTDIKRTDVIALLNKIADRAPVVSNRTLTMLKALYAYADLELNLGVAKPPTDKVDPRTVEEPRERVLSHDEIAATWVASGALGIPYGPFTRLLLMLGVRLGELAGARSSEIDPKAATWTIPTTRTKGKKPHIVPLPRQAVAILNELPQFEGASKPFVFGAELTGFSCAKAKLNALMLEEMRRAAAERGDDPDQVEIEQWQMHDYRRTVVTNLQKLGVPLEVSERILGHKGESKKGVAGIYHRHEFEEEQRIALAKWADKIEEIVADKPAAAERQKEDA